MTPAFVQKDQILEGLSKSCCCGALNFFQSYSKCFREPCSSVLHQNVSGVSCANEWPKSLEDNACTFVISQWSYGIEKKHR